MRCSRIFEFTLFLYHAIARNGQKNQPLSLHYGESEAYEFSYNPNANGHDDPKIQPVNDQVSYIYGEFQKYTFTIRAYKNTGKSLIDVDLVSSEAELMMILNEENIKLEDISLQETYRLRKLEYNLRVENKEKGQKNLNYHLEKMK